MTESVRVRINGGWFLVPEGISVAAALIRSGEDAFRTSVRGERRGPLCGMGICFECRVNARAHVRACQTAVREGMEIRTR